MVATPISSCNLSNYGNRTVTLEVTGVCNQQVMRAGTCRMTTPFSRLSQTIQRIQRSGGKVAKVTMFPAVSPAASPAAAPAASPAAAPTPVVSQPTATRSPEPTKKQGGFQPPKSKRKQKS
jgi:hypothetical protein